MDQLYARRVEFVFTTLNTNRVCSAGPLDARSNGAFADASGVARSSPQPGIAAAIGLLTAVTFLRR